MRSCRFITLLVFLFATCCGRLAGAAEPGPDSALAKAPLPQWILVTAPAFRETLAPLIEQRRHQGLNVVVVNVADVLSAEQIRQGNGEPLQAYLKSLQQNYAGESRVLLAGTLAVSAGAHREQRVVPALSGHIGRMERRPTDFGYGLCDARGSPRTAVGRFPARTVAEMQAMVQKTLKLEEESGPAAWHNRVLLLQGNPGGGPLAEMVVQQTTTPRLNRVHPAWDVQVISHLSHSPFYLPTAALQARAIRSLEAGHLFSLYLGHSNPTGLWSEPTAFLSSQQWAKLNMAAGPGVFFTCGCFACQWDAPKGDAYGIAAMCNPNGPAAIIGATGESFAAPGLLASDGLLNCFTAPPFPVCLADYWLAIQEGLARGPMDNVTFSMFDLGDGTKGKVPLSVQRQEHLEMWTLLGDPALRLPLTPLTIDLEETDAVRPGHPVTIKGHLPTSLDGATVHVSLERPFGSPPVDALDLNAIPKEDRRAREQAALTNHDLANHTVLAETNITAKGLRFDCVLEVPTRLNGSTLIARAYAADRKTAALGVGRLTVKP